MMKAIDIINASKNSCPKDLEKQYTKCTVCGLYDEKKSITTDTIINSNIYVNICNNCIDYLQKGGKLKKRKYFPEEISNYK